MKTYETFTFLISTHDEFETLDQMLDWFENSTIPPQGWATSRPSPNASSFEFVVPAGLDKELVMYIGRGIAFSNDWCMDDTFSAVITGSLDGDETQADDNRSEQQGIDVWDANDPRNW